MLRLNRSDSDSSRPWRRCLLSRLLVFLAVIPVTIAASTAQRPPTAEEYVRQVGGTAHIVSAGEFQIAGKKQSCGGRPTVLDDSLDDFGAAYRGFIILNPKRLDTLRSSAVKWWIYGHECGHQYKGRDEDAADCFAVRRGQRQGWLTARGIEDLCQFFGSATGFFRHFAGVRRCQAVRDCFADR